MSKIWAVLGLALLAGCGGEGTSEGAGPWSPMTTVTVHITNAGSADADGTVADWDKLLSQDFTIAPGQTVTIRIKISYRLKVHVERTSDHQVCLDDFWDAGDIHNDELTLTVNP